jgi:hypothetical protein
MSAWAMRLALIPVCSGPTLRPHIGHVLLVRAEKQVTLLIARRRIAVMKYEKAGGNGTV